MNDASSAMNAVSSHPKLKATLLLRDGVCAAGSTLEGLLEVDSKTDLHLGLGSMVVELIGTEELISKSTTLRAVFLHDINRFQGKDLPPSNICESVQDPHTPLPKGYWPAREGKCSFPLKFHLPDHLPSSLTLPIKLARISFALRSSIAISYKGETAVLITTREAPVVGILDEADEQGEEGWGGQGEEWTGPNEAMWEGKFGGFGGVGGGAGGGKVKVEVGVGERCLVAGRKEVVWLKVSNGSTKKISDPTVTVTRRLLLPHPEGHQPRGKDAETHELVVSDTVLTAPFRGGNTYEFLPGTETVVPLEITIPEDARSIRAGKRPDGRGGKRDSLFEVRCVLDVKIGTGMLGKDIHLELPIFIAHPASLPPAFLARAPPLHPTICPPHVPPPEQGWLQAVPTGSPHFPYTPSSFQPSRPQQRSSSAMSFHAPSRTPMSPAFAAPIPWAGSQPFPSPGGQPYFADSPVGLYPPSMEARSPSVAPPSAWGAPPPPSRPASSMGGGQVSPGSWGGQPSRPPSAMSYAAPPPQQQQWQPTRPSSAMDSYDSSSGGWQGYAPPFSSQQQHQPSYADPRSQQQPHMSVRSSTTPAPYDYHNQPPPALPPHVVAPQADRISHHLRDSSKTRGRSVSPPRSNGAPLLDLASGAASTPWQDIPPPRPPSVNQSYAPVDSNLLRRDHGQSFQPPPRSTPSPAPGSNGHRRPSAATPPGFVPYSSHEVLSPKAIALPELRAGYFDPIGEAGESIAGTMKSVAELERMVEDAEQAAVGVGLMSIVDGQITGPTRRQEREARETVEMNKTLPGPPVPSVRTKLPVASVVAVKPSLLEAFEQAAMEKERRKERRNTAEVDKFKAGERARQRTSSVDLRASADDRRAAPSPAAVSRSTTMPTLAVQIPPTVAAAVKSPVKPTTPLLPKPPAISPVPVATAVKRASLPAATARPLSPATAAASAKTSPRPMTTSLAPTKSALAEIDRLANVKADRVGAWLGGAALARGRGDDSEGTIKGKQRKDIVPMPDLPPLTSAPKQEAVSDAKSKPSATKRASFSFVPSGAPHQQSKTPSPPSTGTSTPIKAATTASASTPVVNKSSPVSVSRPAVNMDDGDDEIVVPARFATRLKKSQLMAGMAADQEEYKSSVAVGSARGGKGGKVADVTKIWATVIDSETSLSAAKPQPRPTSRASTPPIAPKAAPATAPAAKPSPSPLRSSPFLAPKAAPTAATTTSTNPVARLTPTIATIGTPSSAPQSLSAAPRNLIKSTSAPLYLNTSSSKTAHLSSSASLMSPSWAKASPKGPEVVGELGTKGKGMNGTLDKSFSKQKLRELRERYGG